MPRPTNISGLPPVSMMAVVDPKGNPLAAPETEKARLVLMAIFGADTPAEIGQYMKTPAMIEAINIVAAEIMLEETTQKQNEQARRDAEKRRRYLAYLLLGLSYEKKAEAKERYERAMAEYEKISERGSKTAQTEEAKQFSEQVEQVYQSTIESLETYLDQLTKEATKLEKEQGKLLKETKALDEKHQVIDKQVSKALDLIANLDLKNDLEGSKKKIRKEIFILDNKIEALSDEIAEMESKGKNTAEKYSKLNGYTLRRETIENFAKKDFYTSGGEVITNLEEKQARYSEVHFTLKPTLKLAEHGGELMILRKDQDPKVILANKRSEDKLNLAKKTFKIHQDQYSEIAKLFARHKANERRVLVMKAQSLNKQISQVDTRILLTVNQLFRVDEDRNQVNQLKQTQQTRPVMNRPATPTPKPLPPNPVVAKLMTKAYRCTLTSMGKTTTAPDPRKLVDIVTGLSKVGSTDLTLRTPLLHLLERSGLIKHSDKDSLHRQLRSGSQIQPQTVRELQERINQRPETANPLQEGLNPLSMKLTPNK